VSKSGVQNLGMNATIRTNAEHSCSIWRHECMIHYREEDITRYVRNGAITQLSVHCYISIRVHQGTCFAFFSSLLDMKRRISARLNE
jgi:hypothetical protein